MKTQVEVIIGQLNLAGLSSAEVEKARTIHGRNVIEQRTNSITDVILDLIKEPMLLLLIAAATLYFITGHSGDGWFMIAAIVLVTGISLFQESRTRKALEKITALTQPYCSVIRNGQVVTLAKEELVPGDFMIVEEGSAVPADGKIIHSNDFTVNESILTGESLPVQKDRDVNNVVFQGCAVTSGLAICMVTEIGPATRLGKIGKSIEQLTTEATPLQKQISNFVKRMAFIGAIVFLIVWLIHFLDSQLILESLLKALTLAMSILPEEIPVAFTTFMALGSWRLMKLGVIVKNVSTVETLGSASVICLDKTGTITENKMSLAKVYSHGTGLVYDVQKNAEVDVVIGAAMWASEPIPFDPMEMALHEAYRKLINDNKPETFRMVHEYPLSGKPPMMTHVFEDTNGNRIVAAKGSPEALMVVCELSERDKVKIHETITLLAGEGYRVLGVAVSDFQGNEFPKTQQEFSFIFKGLVAFYDPPKSNMKEVLQAFYNAGVLVKIITGDNAATTSTIARQVGFRGYEKSLSGDQLMAMQPGELQASVEEYSIFTRMFPEAKLKIVEALKKNGHIVAMTGDGVNDGPALKTAHIGVAMGKKGSELAKEVSAMILTDDNLGKMIDAIAAGRKIYGNLKKAIQYIVSIHIPIILIVLLPLTLGWAYPAIFTPLHVIFLELIMGPTCSIIYENEPLEKNMMNQPPRPFTSTFFNWSELGTSIIQGLAITGGLLVIYQYAYHQYHEEMITRTMVFTTLIVANICLTLVNRSFYYSVLSTMRYRNNLVPAIISMTLLLTSGFIYMKPLSAFFKFTSLQADQLLISVVVGATSVLWYEVVKVFKRRGDDQLKQRAAI